MADQRPKPKGVGARAASHLAERMVEIVVVLIALYFIASWILNAAAVTAISGSTTFPITNSTTLFSLYGNEYALSLLSASNQTAQVELTQLPTFLNPTLYVNLVLNNATSVSPTLQTNANMQLKYTQLNSKSSVQVTVVPIPVGFTQSPSYSKITVAQTSLAPFGSSYGEINTTSSTTNTTTTISSGSTTVASTTTTVSQTESGNAKALAVVEKTSYYPLMLNYSRLYSGGTSCTPPLYNSTFASAEHSLPSGPSSFYNVSQFVPISLVLNISNTSATNYLATWNTGFLNGTSSAVLVMGVNIQTNQVTRTTIEGLFKDNNENYTSLKTEFIAADSVGNACGIFVG